MLTAHCAHGILCPSGTLDRFFQGDSDDAVAQLVDACGWRAEFDALAEA